MANRPNPTRAPQRGAAASTTTSTSSSVKVTVKPEGPRDHNDQEGIAVPRPGMRPPTPQPNMLNEAMAKEAAVKFKKKQKRIQKACAALDGEQPASTSCGCVIL